MNNKDPRILDQELGITNGKQNFKKQNNTDKKLKINKK